MPALPGTRDIAPSRTVAEGMFGADVAPQTTVNPVALLVACLRCRQLMTALGLVETLHL